MFRNDHFYFKNSLPKPEEFFGMLNSVHHYMGFNNGVLDMKKFCFYPMGAVPRDICLSYSTGYDFQGGEDARPKTDEQRAEMELVESHVARFFPDKFVRKVFKLSMGMAAGAATLSQIQIFLVFYGHLGSNGKSVLLNWVGDVFGSNYLKSLDPANLTYNNTDPNKPQSGLMEIRGCRIARINEAANDKLSINNEFLKRWTGADPLQMRGMYGHSCQTSLDAVPILVVNHLPTFSRPNEDAIMRRNHFVPFESRFVDSVTVANEEANIFLKNRHIEQELKKLVPAFALCLVKWGRELQEADYKIERPYLTFDQINDYAKEHEMGELDDKAHALLCLVRKWIDNNLVASETETDCPVNSDTCPPSLSKGKPSGYETPCPCLWSLGRVFKLFKEANKETTITEEQFGSALRRIHPAEDYIKNRHITGRHIFKLKRKVVEIEA